MALMTSRVEIRARSAVLAPVRAMPERLMFTAISTFVGWAGLCTKPAASIVPMMADNATAFISFFPFMFGLTAAAPRNRLVYDIILGLHLLL